MCLVMKRIPQKPCCVGQVTMTDVPLCPDFLTRLPPNECTSCLRIFDPTPGDAISVPMPLSETMQTKEPLLLMSSICTKPPLRS